MQGSVLSTALLEYAGVLIFVKYFVSPWLFACTCVCVYIYIRM